MQTASPQVDEKYWANEPDIDELRRMYALLVTDFGKAVAGLESLAGRGSTMSMWYLAEAYMGTYAPKDLSRAKYWYGQADEKGASEASFMLGRICAQEGDYDSAFAAFSRGANRGYLPSIYRLAMMYQDGLGTKKDSSRARVLLQEAASKGHVFAKRDLATLYVKGTFGPVLVFRGIALLVTLLFDVVGLVIRAIRRGPIVDDRLLG